MRLKLIFNQVDFFLLFMDLWIFSSGRIYKAIGSAETLSRSHGKPEIYTLPKAFEISRNIARTSSDLVLSTARLMSLTRSIRWFVVESPGRNPDLFLLIK